jgi:chemotaxis protein CheD
MSFRVRHPRSVLPVLPLEYRPNLTEASDKKHVRYYLLPGKVFVSADPVAVTAIVGSSVTLCVWDPVRGVGGAAQYSLPENPHSDFADTKYGDAACEKLLRLLLDLGASQHNLEAKIFGGLQPAVRFGNSANCLGSRNVEAALKFLTAKRIRLAAKEVGGGSGRKVVFHTDDGHTWSEAL